MYHPDHQNKYHKSNPIRNLRTMDTRFNKRFYDNVETDDFPRFKYADNMVWFTIPDEYQEEGDKTQIPYKELWTTLHKTGYDIITGEFKYGKYHDEVYGNIKSSHQIKAEHLEKENQKLEKDKTGLLFQLQESKEQIRKLQAQLNKESENIVGSSIRIETINPIQDKDDDDDDDLKEVVIEKEKIEIDLDEYQSEEDDDVVALSPNPESSPEYYPTSPSYDPAPYYTGPASPEPEEPQPTSFRDFVRRANQKKDQEPNLNPFTSFLSNL
jgi:hypothetical protein